jgi:1-acyl-sn-glycerol-3-phosphate acyltransferase
MAYLWSRLVLIPLGVISTIVFGTVSGVLHLCGAPERLQIEVGRAWARSLLFMGGIRVTVEGLEKIDPKGRYVFASNHLSYVDTPVVFSRIPVQFRFLAKSGLFQIPFLGWHLKTAGHISVPLEDPRAALRTLSRTADLIETKGISPLFFPEGGRSEDGRLREFRDGAAYIAIKAQVPLVPLALIGPHEILPMHSATLRPGKILLRIGDPVPTAGLTLRDRAAVTERVRQQVVGMLGMKPEPAQNPMTEQA